MRIKLFEEFIEDYTSPKEERKLLTTLLEGEEFFHKVEPLINEGYYDGLLNFIFMEGLMEEDLSEDSIIKDKLKQKFDKVVEVAKENGKSALSDVEQSILAVKDNIAIVISKVVETLNIG